MKVAVIAPTAIPSLKANTLQIMKMAQAISSMGLRVDMVIPDFPGLYHGADRRWESLANHYGLQSPFPMTWLPAKKDFRKYDYAWKAIKRARKLEADVIYTRLPQAAAIAANQNMATIFEIHDLPHGTLGPILLRLFLRGSGAKKLIVISRALADDLVQENFLPDDSQRLQVLPDGVDLRRYQDLPAPKESREILSAEFLKQNLENGSTFSPEKFTVGYTGHLYPGRGVSLMMDIAACMPEINFLIVGGEKSDVSKLKTKAKDRQLENVTLTGFIPNAALPKYQAACDVLLMPYQSQVSASSGGDIGRYLSPMKLFEYLACGRTICSSDLPVLHEILSPETAVILPPNKVDSWVDAIQMLSENPNLRNEMGNNARAAAQNYSWEARAEKIFSES